jgi:spore coat polysaccharide biosynthesis protein SpsF (cytidylyltransferase family)
MPSRDERPAIAVVQARMSSTRLPGKSLADLDGEPMLAFLLARLRRAHGLSDVMIATSDEPIDEPIAALGRDLAVAVHRGSRDDVLGRYVGAIGAHDGPVVRVTGDCPLVDPEVVDQLLEQYRATPGCAYASNVQPRTYPDGTDVEVVDAGALRTLAAEAADPAAREHVTLAIRADPARFPATTLIHAGEDLGALRWTVDTADDLDLVRAVVARLGDRRYAAGLEETLAAYRAVAAATP